MAEKHTLSVQTYLVVGALLIAFTILTVAVSFIDLHSPWHIVIGLIIAAVKASLVVLFFMHALLSSRVTWLVISVAVFWLGIMLVLGLTDYFSRGLVPFMYGH